uniref:Protein V2 n=1 Tax=Kudzu mosaic virus TaxID=390437 RepID=E9LZQ4_9GEMI|nr:AV2 protein [Kudzu mosaic virus]
MWDPLLNAFPDRLHGFRCMLAVKYLHLVLSTYPENTVGYWFLRDLIQVLRSKDHDKAEFRYGILKSDILGTAETELRNPVSVACTCCQCPRHPKTTSMDKPSDVQEASSLSYVSKPRRPPRL